MCGRACSPCLLFLDDVDALFPSRSTLAASDNNALDRILSQFLIELDGVNTDPQRPVSPNSSILSPKPETRHEARALCLLLALCSLRGV